MGNGNLFRPSSVVKTQKVLTSLTDAEQRLISEISEQLSKSGYLSVQHVEHVLSKPLFEKLVAAAVYDLNEVTNEEGSHVYVTAPIASAQAVTEQAEKDASSQVSLFGKE